jgi:hypothetical protein
MRSFCLIATCIFALSPLLFCATAFAQVEEDKASSVTISGEVVDDETGKPIEGVMIQGGKFDPKVPGGFDPNKVEWGYYESRSSSNKFSQRIEFHKGWTARVVADGYVPFVLLDGKPDPDKDTIELTVRLKRGRLIKGRVRDHSGKPVEGASVFAVTAGGINVYQGNAWSWGGEANNQAHPVQTNDEGVFSLPVGDSTSIVVSCKQLDAFAVELPAPEKKAIDKKEVKDEARPKEELLEVSLPQPGAIEIELDIPGAPDDGEIFYQMLKYDDPIYKRVESSRTVAIKNGSKIVLDSLTPGRYQFWRNRMLYMKSMGIGGALDRTFLEIKSGETFKFSLVRREGVNVKGTVTWPEDLVLDGVILRVLSGDSVVDARGALDMAPIFDAKVLYSAPRDPASDDGPMGTTRDFETEGLLPGEYKIVIEAYIPLTEEQQFRSGIVGPKYVVEKKIVVTDKPEDTPIKLEIESDE